MENNVWICPNCNSMFHEEQLEDNEDGLCEFCETPLQPLHAETYTPINKEENQPLNNMIYNLKVYPIQEIWHSIELLKDWKNRIEERKLFFRALKLLNKKFELWNE